MINLFYYDDLIKALIIKKHMKRFLSLRYRPSSILPSYEPQPSVKARRNYAIVIPQRLTLVLRLLLVKRNAKIDVVWMNLNRQKWKRNNNSFHRGWLLLRLHSTGRFQKVVLVLLRRHNCLDRLHGLEECFISEARHRMVSSVVCGWFVELIQSML